METKKITLAEVLDLDVQLNGFANDKVEVKGILNEKINIKTKYWLGRLAQQIAKEKQSFESLRDELIKKYGEVSESGNIEIKATIDDKPNPKIFEFQKEIEDLIKEEIEIKFPQLDLESFDFESENNYSYLLKYIVKED